jgi:hypothetical protein
MAADSAHLLARCCTSRFRYYFDKPVMHHHPCP